MTIEAALIKPLVDALLALFREGSDLRLKRDAEAALREVIRELLKANPDENRAQARIAIARAAGIISEDVVLAEDMLEKHRAAKARTAGKAATGRRRGAAKAGDRPVAIAARRTTPRTRAGDRGEAGRPGPSGVESGA